MADIVFVAIVVVSVIIGRRLGFLRGLVNLVSVVAASLGGYLLYPYVTRFLSETPLFETIQKPVNNYITNNYLNGTPIEDLNNMLGKYNVTTIEDLFVKMSEGITIVLLNLISIVAIFILVRVTMRFLKGITAFITKLPVIRSLDKTLGVLLSLISSLLIMYLFVAAMMIPPCNSSEISRKMCDYIDNSVITKHVMDYNIFINYDSLSETGDI